MNRTVGMSLPEDDIRFLDAYAANRAMPTRSAALQQAIRLLRAMESGDEYAAAWEERSRSGDEPGPAVSGEPPVL